MRKLTRRYVSNRQLSLLAKTEMCFSCGCPVLFWGFDKGKQAIPFTLTDYLSLVDLTGRAVREDKNGAIPSELKPILLRLNLDDENWLDEMQKLPSRGITAIATVSQLKRFCKSVGKKWCFGHIIKPALE